MDTTQIKHKLFNNWRSFRYTIKGKKAGFCEKWKTFEGFLEDMEPTHFEGGKVCRIDKKLPFSKDNCIWALVTDFNKHNTLTIKITHNGKTQCIKDWSKEIGLSCAGISMRYHRHKEYTVEEVLFGHKKRPRVDIMDIKNLTASAQVAKISKMISAYRVKDYKRFRIIHKLDKDWFRENIITKPCVYCGDTEKIGCDRIDNDKPHYESNVVPCCYPCNAARNRNFTYDEMLVIGESIRIVKENRRLLKAV